jgi:hypothetical protein
MRGLLKGRNCSKKIVVIMREGPHLRMLFNPMMLAHSALVTQLEFYDVHILKPRSMTRTA